MIRIVPAQARHLEDPDWLKNMLFSFSNYYGPDNNQFGSLRSFNDGSVQPGRCLSTHPHSEMEIISVVLDGEISQEENMGNRGAPGKGEVQCITAGTGILHSGLNRGKEALNSARCGFYLPEAAVKIAYSQKKKDSRISVYMPANELCINGQKIGKGDQDRCDLEQEIPMDPVFSGMPAELSLSIFPSKEHKF